MTMQLPKMPQVTFNKNGYEIRSEILNQAQFLLTEDFKAKYRGWELTVTKDPSSGQAVTTVGMPTFPGLETILETAEKMYAFVNSNPKK